MKYPSEILTEMLIIVTFSSDNLEVSHSGIKYSCV